MWLIIALCETLMTRKESFYIVQYPVITIALIALQFIPGRSSQLNTISASLGSIQQCCS